MSDRTISSESSVIRQPGPGARLLGPALILLAALAAVTPQLISGCSCGMDLEFHFISWVDIQHLWHQGILYPQWKPSSNFFAGEPRFIFYPPLTLMAGALLGMAFPWHLVPIAMTFLMLAGTGLATRALAREALDEAPATIAGCAAMLFGYAMFTAYVRTDFAEMSGGFWIPLLLLFILRDRNASGTWLTRAFDGSAAPLALVVTGAWLCNPPVGVMASYLLAAVALAVALIDRSWAPVLRASTGAALGLGIAAIYWLPAVSEQQWASLASAVNYRFARIQASWLFARHAGAIFAEHDRFLRWTSLIAVCMIAIALTGLLVSRMRGRIPGEFRWWFPLAAIPVMVLFLQFPISQPVWDLVPKLRYLQFPWRWLIVVEAPMGIFFASAIWTNLRRWRIAVVGVCTVLFVLNIVATRRFFFGVCDANYSVDAFLSRYGDRTLSDDATEYGPPAADDALVPMGLPDACLTSDPLVAMGRPAADGTLMWNARQGICDATFYADTPPGAVPAEHMRVRAQLARPGYMVLRLRTYPAWLIRVNGNTITSLPQRRDGLIAVPVPRGPVNLTVDWTTTPDVVAARWISLCGLLLFIALWRLERMLTRLRVVQRQPALSR